MATTSILTGEILSILVSDILPLLASDIAMDGHITTLISVMADFMTTILITVIVHTMVSVMVSVTDTFPDIMAGAVTMEADHIIIMVTGTTELNMAGRRGPVQCRQDIIPIRV